MNFLSNRKSGIFYGMELGIYIAYVTQDIYCMYLGNSPALIILSNFLKLFSVLAGVAFTYHLLSLIPPSLNGLYLVLALFFTFLADIFLLFTSYYPAGIFSFCLVQIFLRLHLDTSNVLPTHLGIGACISSLGTIFLCQILQGLGFYQDITAIYPLLPFLLWIGLFYFYNLLTNLVFVRRMQKRQTDAGMLFGGLVLMLLCDTHVFLYNILSMIVRPANRLLFNWMRISHTLMWIFYLPALLCIFTYIKSNIHSLSLID